MPWVKIDEHFYDHPKWCDAPGDSIALWVALMAWCNRNDSTEGYVPDHKTRGLLSVKSVPKTLDDLTTRGALKRVPGGYLIHDYAEYQQPEKVKEIAAKRRAIGKRGAASRWGEARRAKEAAAAPPLTDADHDRMANDIANDIAIAIPIASDLPLAKPLAKRCPDTETDTEVLHGCTDTPLQQTVPHPVDNPRRNGTRTDPHPIAATLADLTRHRGTKK